MSLNHIARPALVLPYPPATNRMWRMWRGHMVLTPEAKQYKHLVGLRCRAAGWKPLADGVEVFVSVYRPRKSGDLDGRLKVMLDALQGHAYVDDKQVLRIVAERYDDAKRPRVEVRVRPYWVERCFSCVNGKHRQPDKGPCGCDCHGFMEVVSEVP